MAHYDIKYSNYNLWKKQVVDEVFSSVFNDNNNDLKLSKDEILFLMKTAIDKFISILKFQKIIKLNIDYKL